MRNRSVEKTKTSGKQNPAQRFFCLEKYLIIEGPKGTLIQSILKCREYNSDSDQKVHMGRKIFPVK